MKRLYFIISLLIITLNSNAQNVTIPDANFKAYLLNKSSINTNQDTEIQVSEAAAFTGRLSCPSRSISDLTGIEAFTNLTELNCSNNNLTQLVLGNKPSLKILSCWGNNLITLNISQCPSLEELNCSRNSFTNLDLSQNTQLVKLTAQNLDLPTLDLSTNVNLKNLNVSWTALDYLDLSALVALETFKCRENGLATIDVSNNINLKEFDASYSNFVYLDLSNNPALEDVDLRSNNLIWVNAANGNNDNLLIWTPGNPNLVCIEVDSVALSANSSNWWVDSWTSFSTNCSACVVDIPDANLKTALVGNTAINTNGDTEIQCTEAINYTGSLDVSSLNIADMNGIEALVGITSLDCSNNSFDSLALMKNIKLTSLDASNNPILEDIWCYGIGSGFTTLNITSTPALQLLDCSYNNLTSLDVSANTALFYLACSGNNLTSLDVSANTALFYLACSGNNLTNLNLSSNTLLENLVANETNLSNLNLTSNTELEILRVGNNSLASLDLNVHTALRILSVNGNNLTSLDLSNNPALVILAANSNNLSSLNLKNLTPSSFNHFDARNNPNLECIEVDDVTAATATWIDIDTQSYFSVSCVTSVVGIPTLENINIYPNPTTGKLTVDLGATQEDVTITVYNVVGAEMSRQSYQGMNLINLDVEAEAGIYLMEILSETGKRTTIKVIKE